jgi:hypothetical protein
LGVQFFEVGNLQLCYCKFISTDIYLTIPVVTAVRRYAMFIFLASHYYEPHISAVFFILLGVLCCFDALLQALDLAIAPAPTPQPNTREIEMDARPSGNFQTLLVSNNQQAQSRLSVGSIDLESSTQPNNNWSPTTPTQSVKLDELAADQQNEDQAIQRFTPPTFGTTYPHGEIEAPLSAQSSDSDNGSSFSFEEVSAEPDSPSHAYSSDAGSEDDFMKI